MWGKIRIEGGLHRRSHSIPVKSSPIRYMFASVQLIKRKMGHLGLQITRSTDVCSPHVPNANPLLDTWGIWGISIIVPDMLTIWAVYL